MDTANERPLTHRWLDVLIALGVFAASLTAYVLTLTPSLSSRARTATSWLPSAACWAWRT
jgi:hypothetical protein